MIGKLTRFLLVVGDVFFIQVAMMIAYLLRYEGNITSQYQQLYKETWLVITVCMLVPFVIFKLYHSLWRYASVRELIQVVGACLMGDLLLIVIGGLTGVAISASIYAIYPLVLIPFVMMPRFGYRLLRKLITHPPHIIGKNAHLRQPRKRVMIIGAGQAASIVIKDMKANAKTDKQVILAVDDQKSKQGASLHGVPVKGDTTQIVELVKRYRIEEIIIAMPSVSKKRLAEVLEICNETTCKLKIFPGIDHSLDKANGKEPNSYIRDVKVEDLLGREEIIISNTKLKGILEDQVILVTGGGGSIGSELCRQIVNLCPKLLVVVEVYENSAYDLQMELIQNGVPKDRIKIIIASIRDKKRLKEIFEVYRPHLVFHAAAHKHVPLMEECPSEAVKNNVFGTLNVAQCAVAYGVSKFVMISTDKAVNPTNVMGATKRICEMIIQSINTTTPHTDFVAVRFGNVLGSNGSVIPLFKKQIEGGGPLTVTHPDIIRYFMTIPEAVRLILEATTFAKGGEIFVLDMGKPVKIVDLAKNLVKLSGLKLDQDIKIEFTGLRPGEKLFEELLMEEEGLGKTLSDKIFVGKPGEITYSDLMQKLDRLKLVVEQEGDIRRALMDVVPTYRMPGSSEQVG